MVAQVPIIIILDDGRELPDGILQILTEEDGVLLRDGTLGRHQTLPFLGWGGRGSLVVRGISPTVEPAPGGFDSSRLSACVRTVSKKWDLVARCQTDLRVDIQRHGGR